MHSSGSIARKFGPSWKQSTGHTSTQSVYLHFTQLSVTTKVIGSRAQSIGSASNDRTYSASIEAAVVKSHARDGRSGLPDCDWRGLSPTRTIAHGPTFSRNINNGGRIVPWASAQGSVRDPRRTA